MADKYPFTGTNKHTLYTTAWNFDYISRRISDTLTYLCQIISVNILVGYSTVGVMSKLH